MAGFPLNAGARKKEEDDDFEVETVLDTLSLGEKISLLGGKVSSRIQCRLSRHDTQQAGLTVLAVPGLGGN